MADFRSHKSSLNDDFLNGTVFGFDIGTGSIGYAVRKGKEFLDVGVLICPEDTAKLDTRRGLRSQRRCLRNRFRVRDWLAKQLDDLELPSPYVKSDTGQLHLKPGLEHKRISNPVLLRCEALEGRLLKPEELHAALAHLWKRRGKTNVPWKQEEKKEKTPEQKTEEKKVAEKLGRLEDEMKAGDGTRNPDGTPRKFEHPCELLLHRQQKRVKQRDEVWPRDEFQNENFSLKKEFLAIVEKQSSRFKKLAGKVTYLDDEDNQQTVSVADWILYGDSRTVIKKGKERRVFFKTTECRNPGVLGLRWPRFDNRNPGLDLLKPFDESGRLLHVVRRNKPVFRETQFEQALFNFRVVDKITGKKVLPDMVSLNRLREIYESSKRKSKKAKKNETAKPQAEMVEIKITESVLNRWAKEFSNRYQLIEDQPELVSRTGDGRAKFCSATLRNIKSILEGLSAGQTFDSIQPLLRRPHEPKEDAMDRFLDDIRHGLVRHRLNLFLRLLRRLIQQHRSPDFIVVEAVRSLAFSRKKKDEHKNEQRQNRDKRQKVYEKLKDEGQSTSKQAQLRYRLADEAGFECPFCRQSFDQAALYNGDVDISHLYPNSLTPCNEFYNLTVAHIRCNRTDMEAKIPRDAFGSDPLWPYIEDNARKRFSGKKLELFLAATREEAEQLIEAKASLTATAYISKMVRRLCLIELEWHGKDGRDPTDKQGNIPSKQFLVTNGEITARFREAWELNEILHPTIPSFSDEAWRQLTAEEKQAHKDARKKRHEKNRGDHRHHALDAMVIACTWPAYAQRVHNATKDWEEKGWWYFDGVKRRLMARHPLFETFEPMKKATAEWMQRIMAENRVQHHASQSKHKQAYKTSFFSRRPDEEKVGEHFYLLREKLLDISPKDLRLRKVYPPALSDYLYTAWDGYLEKLYSYTEKAAAKFAQSFDGYTNLKEAGKAFAKRLDWSDFNAWLEDQTKTPSLAAEEAASRIALNPKALPQFTRDKDGKVVVKLPEPEKLLKTMPEDFQQRLCFARYQRWNATHPIIFTLPKKEDVQIPIVRVRLRQPVNDKSVAVGPKTIPGWGGGHVYVKRDSYREVRLMPYARGAGVVPVFVPQWRDDKPFSAYDFDSSAKPVLIIRKNKMVTLKRDYSANYPAGDYLIEVLGEHQVTLAKPHVANTKEAHVANDFPATGFKPYWHILIPALGFEFPKSVKIAEEKVKEEENDDNDQ